MTEEPFRVQSKGKEPQSAEESRKAGLKAGDLLAVGATDNGVLIAPCAGRAIKALDQIGEALLENGVTHDEWIESGREVRSELIEKHYGIPIDQQRE